jgi:diguanylate cyclase (GGDEF)-like protein
MNSVRKKYQILIISVLLIFGIIISIVYSYALDSVERNYRNSAGEGIIEVKKSFLEDTVNNLILSIDVTRKEQIDYYARVMSDIDTILSGYLPSDADVFTDSVIKELQRYKEISAVLIVKETGEVKYKTEDRIDQERSKIDGFLNEKKFLNENEISFVRNASAVFAEYEYKDVLVILSVAPETIDELVKQKIYDDIHGFQFSNDAYLWVNEIIDYDGGDNYAIRRIHPNLKDTEGMYLSTNMTDIAGNLPYLEELEGVKQNGELFFNYFFKKKNSETISEKITYAKLYREYNWIVAMGVHLDDLKAYSDQAAEQSEKNTRDLMLTIAVITIALMAGALVFIFLLEKWYFRNANKELNEKVFKDHLTTALNRRAAENILSELFKQFKATGRNASLIMIDLDNFKKINDECGHDRGDIVLKQTAEIIGSNIRSTDSLCRWGGDEFLMICSKMNEQETASLTDKLLGLASRLEIECLSSENKHAITLSMGVSSFISTDAGYSEAIVRADKALYRSKAQGRNQANIE